MIVWLPAIIGGVYVLTAIGAVLARRARELALALWCAALAIAVGTLILCLVLGATRDPVWYITASIWTISTAVAAMNVRLAHRQVGS